MTNTRIDVLNIGLIVISFIAALLFPFSVFLFAYAVLGPLHYLTEINWIRSKKYFTDSSSWKWTAMLFSIGLTIPLFISHFVSSLTDSPLSAALIWFSAHTNALIFIALSISVSFVVTSNKKIRFAIAFASLIAAIFLNNAPIYILLIGALIPTIIHVYIFTLLFMISGALKSKSRLGFLSSGLMILIAIAIIFLPIDGTLYHFSDLLKSTFLENNFHVTNTIVRQALGVSDGRSFFFYETLELKVQIFIAFAYIYHYLNWFSKTTIIGWHKNLTKSSSLVILFVWLAIVILFAIDYKTGFVIALFFSFLHVILEFPVNVLSIKQLIYHFKKTA